MQYSREKMSALTVAAIVIGTAAVSITAYDMLNRRQSEKTQEAKPDAVAPAPAVVVPYGLPYNVWGSDYPIWRGRHRYRDDADTTQVINNNNNNTVTVVPPTTQQTPTPTPQVPQVPQTVQVPQTIQSPQVTSESGLSQLHPRIGMVTSAPSIHRAKPHPVAHHPKLFQREATNYTTGVNDHALF